MPTTSLLLAQPLKLTDINIKIFDEEDEKPLLPPSLDKIIDDAELLAILGLSSQPSSQQQVSSLNSNSLLDWDHITMPELSESEEEDHHHHQDSKRKHIEEEDVFAQYDFQLYPTVHKKVKSC